ncbi:MAG: helix-turn-helix domain-containing protein [Tannerellaceae bacterium]|jgi:AraC-like DNA-binding protein|nr:helix-turn-helix domain-containing protein [Tannerellaceae bacterium]
MLPQLIVLHDVTLGMMFLLISSYLAIFYTIFIFIKKEKHLSDVYLSICLVWTAIYLLAVAFKWHNVDICLSFLLYVFMYFYILSTTRASVFKVEYVLHFLPFCLLCGIYIFDKAYFDTHRTLFMCLQISIFTVYLYLMRKWIRNYERLLNMNYSTSDRADLSWLSSLVFCLGGCYYAGMIGYIAHIAIGTEMRPDLVDFAFFLFLNIVGLKGIRRNGIFVIRILSEQPTQPEEPFSSPEEGESTDTNAKEDSYLNYGLKKQDALILAERLKEYMDKEKPYINADLDLRDLAAHLNVYPHYVTQVLNTLFNQNFYEFVNTHRVNEAKKHLKDSSRAGKVSILSIAYGCGFNSKSSFNRIFKQKTGMTPSEFRDNQSSEEAN